MWRCTSIVIVTVIVYETNGGSRRCTSIATVTVIVYETNGVSRCGDVLPLVTLNFVAVTVTVIFDESHFQKRRDTFTFPQ